MALKRISPEELFERMKQGKVLVLDVRAEEKYNEYHIEDPGVESLNIDKNNIFSLEENKENTMDALPKGKEIIVTCTTGNSASKCAAVLSDRDYDVAVLDGGITAWKKYLETK